MEWQPIETAPRDGTEVLLFDNGIYGLGWWALGEWRDFGDAGCAGSEAFAPTHWMPLPKPPRDFR